MITCNWEVIIIISLFVGPNLYGRNKLVPVPVLCDLSAPYSKSSDDVGNYCKFLIKRSFCIRKINNLSLRLFFDSCCIIKNRNLDTHNPYIITHTQIYNFKLFPSFLYLCILTNIMFITCNTYTSRRSAFAMAMIFKVN